VATDVINRQRLARIDPDAIRQLADTTLISLGKPSARVSVVFVRDRAIRSLNRQYRGVDRATDVLSFPAGEAISADDQLEYLGDVVISTDTAIRQARSSRHSLAREIEELLIHGLLHLCGYDHETDRGRMNRLELKLRRQLIESRD
jgi:probable rRNA maturation factor